MEKLMPVLEVVAMAISVFSIGVLVFGVFLCAVHLVQIIVSKETRSNKLQKVKYARIELGGFVLLGLEILIVADIVETVIRPDFNEILLLAAIVLIRTVISFFLNKEVRETREQWENQA